METKIVPRMDELDDLHGVAGDDSANIERDCVVEVVQTRGSELVKH